MYLFILYSLYFLSSSYSDSLLKFTCDDVSTLTTLLRRDDDEEEEEEEDILFPFFVPSSRR
jgi:hypothetical protein